MARRPNPPKKSNQPNPPKPIPVTKEMAERRARNHAWWVVPENRQKVYNRCTELMIQGKGPKEVRRILPREFPVGTIKSEKLFSKIRKEWAIDDAENRKHLRATHARRLLDTLAEARKAEAWGPVFAGEAVYGKVVGTVLPETIHVHMDRVDLVAQVFSGMDDERLKQLYERQLVREKMLAAQGLSLPTIRDGTVVDIDPNDVQVEVEAALVERIVESDGGE